MSPRVFWITCWQALALAGLPSCGGERIRLGDAAVAVGGAGGGGDTNAAGDAAAGDAGNVACPAGQALASEVLWIGDSWIQIPGTQHTRVRDLARATGAIGPTDDYANEAAA